jgi:hypothetical protein
VQPAKLNRFFSRDLLKRTSWMFPLHPPSSSDFPRFTIASNAQRARHFSGAEVCK